MDRRRSLSAPRQGSALAVCMPRMSDVTSPRQDSAKPPLSPRRPHRPGGPGPRRPQRRISAPVQRSPTSAAVARAGHRTPSSPEAVVGAESLRALAVASARSGAGAGAGADAGVGAIGSTNRTAVAHAASRSPSIEPGEHHRLCKTPSPRQPRTALQPVTPLAPGDSRRKRPQLRGRRLVAPNAPSRARGSRAPTPRRATAAMTPPAGGDAWHPHTKVQLATRLLQTWARQVLVSRQLATLLTLWRSQRHETPPATVRRMPKRRTSTPDGDPEAPDCNPSLNRRPVKPIGAPLRARRPPAATPDVL